MSARVAVVAAVRDRVDLVRSMLASLLATADEPDRVEVVLRCDVDDQPMIAALCELGQRFIVGPREKGYASLPAFANEAARLTTAPVVIVVNDDAEFVTQGWDTKIVQAADAYPDGMFVFGVETANAENFVFPCVGRRWIHRFGGIFDERVIYADVWIRDVFYPFGRAIRLPDVVIAHHWQGLSPDQVQATRNVHGADYQAHYRSCVEDGRAKVQQVLEEVCA